MGPPSAGDGARQPRERVVLLGLVRDVGVVPTHHEVEARHDAERLVAARAERAGVLIALPLTACFLPAFLVLGLAPVVISLGTELLS